MTHDPVNKVMTITIQTSQFIHFRLRLQKLVANSSRFIVMNWNKSGNIYSN